MRKTGDLFKKIGDTKRKFQAKMGMINDRNSKDLTEAEDIKKRQQEYTEEIYEKGLNDLDNHDGVVTVTLIQSQNAKASGCQEALL